MTVLIKKGRPRLPDSEQAVLFKFRIRPAQLELLRETAAAQGVTMTALVLSAINKELEAAKNNKPISLDNQCDWVSD
ncbi:MAG: DUF1778 domain-containing protein [Enterovibrio sp.]